MVLLKTFYRSLTFLSILILGKFSLLNGQNYILKKSKLDNFIKNEIGESQQSFNWSNYSDTIILSGLINSDSLLSIGFSTYNKDVNRSELHSQDFRAKKWEKARSEILTVIKEHYKGTYDLNYIFPFGEIEDRPFVCARIFDASLLNQLTQKSFVRYTDPMTYLLGPGHLKSSSGCSPVNLAIEANDTTFTSPNSVISWHNINHNIEAGWSQSNKGESINIAVFDTGLSPIQSKLNIDFFEGESSGRTLVKKGFYAPTAGGVYDGWEDQCGHGTAMSGLATAPKGFDNTPSGVAYKSNLISYRCTEDVVINTAQEKMGVSESFFHAADTTVHIISMSLGDLFYNGMVADAISYAEGKDKLIFAAAGTSTFITNGFGVIFPADMNQTIAVTGVKEGSSPFTRCETCHDGPEVDFVVEMERTNNTNLHSVSLGEPDLNISYVGGSSCATATCAGQAALVWSNDLSMNKAQVLDRLMRAANYYPNKNENHGWGTIDLDLATSPEKFTVCDDSLSYSISLEITNITFPPTSDGIFNNTAEWVIEIEGQSFFFEVSTSGDSNSPSEFLNNNTCGYYPMIIDLGNNQCTEAFINNVSIITHEDDGGANDCVYSSTFDDDYSSTLENIDFFSNSFSHTSSAGTFSFSYNVFCTPVDVPSISIVGDSLLCINGSDGQIEMNGSNGIAPYSIDFTINGGSAQNINTDGSGIAVLHQNTTTAGPFVYNFNKVTDDEGCVALTDETHTFFVSPEDYSTNGYGQLSGVIDYDADFETNGIIDAIQIIQPSSQVDYDSGTEINLLPGFEVKSGAIFFAFIDGCNEGSGGLNIDIEETTNKK